MPYLFFIGSVALCMGILNAFGHFMAPAVAPIFLNLCMIVSVPLSMQWGTSLVGKVQWLAASVVVGGVLQLLAQLPWLYQNRIRPFASICFWNPWISRILRPLGSVLFGTAVFQINSLVITLLATLLPQGSVSYLYYADRLVQLPLGVFAMATATAVLPTLARQASAERLDDLRTTFAHALRFVFFMTLPAMVGLIVLRTPIVTLLFQHGAFDTLSTRLTAGVLLYYGMGLWSFAALRIVLSVFFAQKQTRAPFWSGIVSVVVNFGLGLILMDTMGPNGLALALSLASMVHFFLLVWVLRRKLGSLGWRGIAISVSKSAFCSVIMGVVVWGLSCWMTSMPGSLVSSPLMRVVVGVLVGTAIFGVTAYTLKLAELKTLGALFARG
jgi:putative peptidoglycan lipid II flippase